MIWKKGVAFREMPPLAMIQSITVQYQKGLPVSGALISKSMFAGMRRDNQRIPEGRFFFYMDFETQPTGLHIYPTPDKRIVVKVRYLPKVVEI